MPITLRFKDKNDIFHQCALLFVIFGRMNNLMLESDLAFLFVIGVAGIGILLKSRTLLDGGLRYPAWLVGFLALYIVSSMWAEDASRTYTNFIATTGRMIVVLYIFLYMKDMVDVRKVVNIFLTAVVLNSLFVLVVYGPGALIAVREEMAEQSAGNNNGIGMSAAWAAVLDWYLGTEPGKKRNPFKILLYLLLVAMVLLSGSKKALLILVLAVATMYILTRRNKLTVALIVVAAVLVLYQLLIAVPVLYRLVGFRIEEMVQGTISMLKLDAYTLNELMDTSLSDSDRVRYNMVFRGLEWAKERPIFGYGMANYIILYARTYGNYLYAHNNYIEILVGLGIVGVVWYYSLHLGIVRRIWKPAKTNRYAKIAMMLIILTLVLDFGLVSYLELDSNLVLCIAFCIARTIPKNKGDDRNGETATTA